MGLRFRKSVTIIPGVKLNLNKKSTSISIGNKYAGITVNNKNGTYVRASLPRTGISYTEKISKNKDVSENTVVTQNVSTLSEKKTNKATSVTYSKWVSFLLCITLGWLGAHKFYEKKYTLGILYLLTMGLFFFGVIVDALVILFKRNNY